MATSLLRKVKAKTALRAHRKVRSVLDGEHGSIHKGRSMDFDDLREYVLGDDVKDLDWKATARTGRPLVKRFVATRQHAVMLVVDTGRSMSALADATSTKRDVAVFAAGVVAQLATRHGDLVGLLAGPAPPNISKVRNAARALYIPPGSRDVHIERILRTIHDAIDTAGLPSHLDVLLDYAAQNLRRQMILVVIADDTDLTDRHRVVLRRLDAQHEVLFCCCRRRGDDRPGAARPRPSCRRRRAPRSPTSSATTKRCTTISSPRCAGEPRRPGRRSVASGSPRHD